MSDSGESEGEGDGKGEVYVITCKTTKLQYVGAAKEYMGADKQNWGTKGRWTRHIYDSSNKERAGYNTEFYQAIRKYGKDDFEVKTICIVSIEDMYDHEKHYIKTYNTLHPNGYNMTEGGKNGKHCEASNIKKLVVGRKYSEEDNRKKSERQLGTRFEQKERKNADDNHLPKNISAIRKDNILVGYQIKKFPVGIDKPEYIYKTFKNKSNPEIALEMAIENLETLKIDYIAKVENHKKDKQEQAKALEASLPENVYSIKSGEYFVKDMVDYKNDIIPKRDFKNMEDAVKFIKSVEDYNKEKKIPFDWSMINLSREEKDAMIDIVKTTYAGVENGYRVRIITGYNEKRKPITRIENFTGTHLTMEKKYELAVQYVNQIKIET
jgi:hypothetical protein